MSASGEPPESEDGDAVPPRFLVRMSHRGRMVRVFLALGLTALGLVPVPYVGWAGGTVLFAPAAVLLAFAGMERARRRGVLLCAVPTIIGLILAGMSCVTLAMRSESVTTLGSIVSVSLVTSLVAALLGRPPNGA